MGIEAAELTVELEPPRIGWGWYLGAGIAWVLIGLSLLSWNPATIALIAIMLASVVVLAGLMEFALAFASPSWRWLHALAGVVFVVAGIMAMTTPFRTFVSLAMLFGWYLLVKGLVVVITSLALRQPGSLWGFGVFVGVIDMLIGLWAIGYPGRSAWLLVLWIGIGAIMHGIGDIVMAFEVRAADR